MSDERGSLAIEIERSTNLLQDLVAAENYLLVEPAEGLARIPSPANGMWGSYHDRRWPASATLPALAAHNKSACAHLD